MTAANPINDRMTFLAGLSIRLYCPRCNQPQEATARWFGNTVAAYVSAVAGPHPCPGPTIDPADPADPASTVPLW